MRMRQAGEGARVLNHPAGEVDVRADNQGGSLIHGLLILLKRHSHHVGCTDRDGFDARLRLPLVPRRRKLQRAHDHAGTGAVVDGRGDRGKRRRHRWEQRHFPRLRAEHSGHPLPQRRGPLPPGPVPRRRTGPLPEAQVLLGRLGHAPAKRRERAGVQIGGLFEDGKLGSVGCPGQVRGLRGPHHRPTTSRTRARRSRTCASVSGRLGKAKRIYERPRAGA